MAKLPAGGRQKIDIDDLGTIRDAANPQDPKKEATGAD